MCAPVRSSYTFSKETYPLTTCVQLFTEFYVYVFQMIYIFSCLGTLVSYTGRTLNFKSKLKDYLKVSICSLKIYPCLSCLQVTFKDGHSGQNIWAPLSNKFNQFFWFYYTLDTLLHKGFYYNLDTLLHKGFYWIWICYYIREFFWTAWQDFKGQTFNIKTDIMQFRKYIRYDIYIHSKYLEQHR